MPDTQFRPLPAATRRQLRGSLRIAEDEFVLLYTGRITVEKNFPAIFGDAESPSPIGNPGTAGRGFEDAPFLEFGIAFTGLEGMVDRLIEQWGLSGYVQFVPWSSAQRLNELYGVADAFVNLTLHHDENFGYAQVEAMSAGLPCVLTGWGGLKDTVVDGHTGYVGHTWWARSGVRIDLPRAVAGLRRLAGNGSLRESMAARARARAVEQYGLKTYETTATEADALRHLSRWEATSRADMLWWNVAVASLLDKGLVGASRQVV